MAAASQASGIAFPDPTDDMVIRGQASTEAKRQSLPHADRWTGLYAGLAAGYGMIWDSQNATAKGVDFGGFAGYNIRAAGPIVGGLEAEYMHINREFSDDIGVIAQDTFTAKLRLGYAHDRFFAYAVVGAQHATSGAVSAHVPGLKSADTTYVRARALMSR